MPLAAMPLTPGKLNCNCRQRNPSMPYNLCMMTMMMMMCDFFFLQRRTILIFSIFQKQWKSTQNLTEQIFEKPFYLQFNWQKLRWTRIKKIYKFLLQTQRDENIEWLSNSIHETIRFAFCTLYSSPYCLWSESISAKWLFWAVAAATNEHKTNTEKIEKHTTKNQMKTKHILDSISYEDTNPPTVERPLLRHTNYFHSNHAQFDKEVNISQFPSSNETKKKKTKMNWNVEHFTLLNMFKWSEWRRHVPLSRQPCGWMAGNPTSAAETTQRCSTQLRAHSCIMQGWAVKGNRPPVPHVVHAHRAQNAKGKHLPTTTTDNGEYLHKGR